MRHWKKQQDALQWPKTSVAVNRRKMIVYLTRKNDTNASPCFLEVIKIVLCFRKHYREYLVSLINGHSIDPALLYAHDELIVACRRYHVDVTQGEGEDERAYFARLLKVGWCCPFSFLVYKHDLFLVQFQTLSLPHICRNSWMTCLWVTRSFARSEDVFTLFI